MSRVTIAEWYRRVNAAWPADVPKLSEREAIRAARRLYRFEFGKPWPEEHVLVSSGNRRVWIRRGFLVVNPDLGWKDLVHDLSHLFHYRRLPDVRPHGPDHARLELRLIKEVVRRGWLSGALRDPAPTPPPPPEVAALRARQARVASLDARILRWERKRKRAETALRKLARERSRAVRSVAAIAGTVGNPTP